MKKQKIPFGLYNAILCLLVAVILVLVCLCAEAAEEKYYLKWDLSDDGITALSDYSLSRLEALDAAVTIVPVWGSTANDLQDLQRETLQKMAALSEWIQLDPIEPTTQPQRLMALAGDVSVAEGTIFVCHDARIVRIDAEEFVFSQRIGEEIYTIYCGEAMIVGALERVSTENPVRAYFLAGHGEKTMEDCSRLTLQMRALGYDVAQGHLAMLEPAPGDVLVCIAPRSDLTGDEANRLKNFLDAGGNLVLALGADTPPLPQYMALCDVYGLGAHAGWVVEDADQTAFYVDRPELLSPVLAADNGLMDKLPGRLILPRAAALATPQIRPGLTSRVLLTTSDTAVRRADVSADAYAASAEDVTGRHILAAMTTDDTMHLLLLGSEEMLCDSAAMTGASVIDASENLAFMTACLEEMTERGMAATLDAGVKRLPAQLITFDSQRTQRIVSILMLTVLPGLTLLAMAVVLIRRRRL